MAKYHISKNGNPAACSASVKACPLGGEDQHYATEAEARQAYEAQMGSGLSREDQLASEYKRYHTPTAYPADPSREDLMRAAAWAKQNGQFAPAGYSSVRPTRARQDWDEEMSYTEVEARTFTMATPTGEFVRVSFKTGVDGEIDNGWEYRPDLLVDLAFYPNASAVRKDVPFMSHREYQGVEGENQYLRIRDRWSDRPSYSHHDYSSTLEAANKLMQAYAQDPTGAAMAALLRGTKRRLDSSLVEKAANHRDSYVRAEAAKRKELPRSAHGKLAADGSAQVRQALGARTDLTDATVELIASAPRDSFTSPYEYKLGAYTSPSASARLQRKWAKSAELRDLEILAQSRTLDPEARKIMEKRTEGLGVRFRWAT